MKRTLVKLTVLMMLAAFALPGCEARRAVEKQGRIDDYMARANQYREDGLEDSAFAMFGQALLENPRVVGAHIGIGDIYKDRGDYDKASVRFELAAAIEPTNYDAHYNLGVCKQVLGDLPYAIKAYRRAINLVPDSADANRDLASAYLQEGKPGLALSYAKRATELDNDSFGAWANLGFIYSRTERFSDAIDAFRSASELAGSDDDIQPVLVGLADAHIRLGNYTRATNTLNTIIATNPTSTAHERLGVCLFKQRMYEDALREFKKAVELDGNDTAALNGLGVAYMTLYIEGGRDNTYQRDQAIKAWSKSLDLKPGQRSIIALVSRYSDI
ncbi:MAG: tetratricopeptide repeat protein [Phycisphaeraceae bacterium]|nr:tetratricopeptide repeat protein [Phycisphaeraceae bacterium]